jgi:hypothetical protein
MSNSLSRGPHYRLKYDARLFLSVDPTQTAGSPLLEKARQASSGEEPTRLSHQHSRQPSLGNTLAEKVILVLWPVIL